MFGVKFGKHWRPNPACLHDCRVSGCDNWQDLWSYCWWKVLPWRRGLPGSNILKSCISCTNQNNLLLAGPEWCCGSRLLPPWREKVTDRSLDAWCQSSEEKNNWPLEGRGWDKCVWKGRLDEESSSLTLSLLSPDGDQGFPGDVLVSVTYALGQGTLNLRC